MKKKLLSFRKILVVFSLFTTGLLNGQALFNLQSGNWKYLQDFNSLPATSTPAVNYSSFENGNWLFSFSGTTQTTFSVNNGISSSGGIYSYGATDATERALGSLGSGTPGNMSFALKLSNNTSGKITSLSISYNGEQWRNGGNTTKQKLTFSYSYNNISYTAVNALDFEGPIATATAGFLDGNTTQNKVAITSNFTIDLIPNDLIYLKWYDANDSGNDHGLSIDDLVITATVEPFTTPIISCSDQAFGLNPINTNVQKKLIVSGLNLTENIDVSISGTGFTLNSPSTIDKDGAEVDITFNAATKGNYTGKLTLTSGSVTKEVNLTASTFDPVEFTVSNIAALKAKGITDQISEFLLTGDLTFVYRNGRYIYVQDASGGLLIYDNSTAIITKTYTEGDVIQGGLKGKISVFNGLFQLVPTTDLSASTSNIGAINPSVITMAELATNYSMYDSKLIKINGLPIPAGSTFNTSTVTNVYAKQGTDSVTIRNNFKTVAGNFGLTADVTGFANIYTSNGKTTYQIYPRSISDITGMIAGINSNKENNLKVITKDGGLTVSISNPEILNIYNLSGVNVFSKLINNENTFIKLERGIYVLIVKNQKIKLVI